MLSDSKSQWTDVMTKTFQALARGFSVLALCAATLSPAVAQTVATPPAADAAVPTDLSMGAEPTQGIPTQAEAEVGKTYLAASFDQWEQRCVKTADGSDPCQLYQLLVDKDGNAVAEISLFDLPAGGQAAAGATFMAPLETLLTANLKITVDTGKVRVYPFAFCTKQGCVARLGFTADELAAFKKGVKGVLTIVPAAAPDKSVDLELPLKGFTAGFEAVKAANTKTK
jgi:invasion protein IalB